MSLFVMLLLLGFTTEEALVLTKLSMASILAMIFMLGGTEGIVS